MKINIKERSYALTSNQSEVEQKKKEVYGEEWELEDKIRYDNGSQAKRYKV